MKKKTYEQELFEAYIATPEKFEWYKKAFDHFDANDGKARWYWNSWAMIGNFWYFIYRKQTQVALAILFVTLLCASLLPLIYTLFYILFLSIAMGGFGTYFVYDHYQNKKKELEQIVQNETKSIIIMKHQIGGVNRWAIWFALVSLVAFSLILYSLVEIAKHSTLP